MRRPAIIVALAVTGLLILGTTESARVNAILVAIKVAALTVFIVLTLPVIDTANLSPFAPNGLFGAYSGMGIVGAAASIFALTAGRALDALARLSKAVGASADDWSVLIRIGEERAATRRGR